MAGNASGVSTPDTSVPIEVALSRAAAAFPIVAKRSTTLSFPTPKPASAAQEPKAPGDSKWVVLAALAATGAVVAAIMLWPDGGGKSKQPAGTVIVPGTPAIATPR